MTQRKMHPSATPRLSRQSLRLTEEVRSIQDRAAEHDGRVVGIGPLVLFCTDSGDAWILEPANRLACRLAVGGDPLPVHIAETDASYTISWQGHYRIDGETFFCEDRQSRRLVAIQGYPVHQLLRTIGDAARP